MSRRLRRAAAVLFVVAAALFVIGVATESDSHSETSEPAHDESGATAAHDESAEAGHDEPGAAGVHDESGEHSDHTEEGSVLGVDVESPAAVTAAAVASVVIAIGLWLLNRRWLALLAVGFGFVFAVFDVAEISHQLDESRAGLAVLAAAIAAVHMAASASSGLSIRPGRPL